jgi:dolichyl-diphosphooligosaccharide--protein glycosyltransferase
LSRARLRALLPWLALFLAALAVRSLSFGFVFVDGDVRFPFGVDELYHMRRIWFMAVNFPATLGFDLYLNFPHGAPPIWSPFFDWTIAAVARALVGASDRHAVEAVAAWAPPVLGAIAVLVATGPARSAYSPAAGWWTGWLLLTPPAHVFLSEPGQVDHHVAVGILAALLLMAALPMTRPVAPDTSPRGAVATGVVAAAAILLWAGALLHVLILQVFLTLQLVATEDRSVARARARSLALMHGVAALGVAPYCLGRSWEQFGAFSVEVHSSLQPLWLAAGATAFGLTAWLWGREALGGSRGLRLVSALSVAVPGIAAAWWGIPGLADSVQSAGGWFSNDRFLARILEMKPLLFAGDRFAPAIAHEQFSYLFWSFPFFLCALLWQALRAKRTDRLLLTVAAGTFMAAGLYQQRFLDVACAGYAWVLGPAIAEGFAAVRRRRSMPRWLPGAAALGVGLAAVLPVALTYPSELARSIASHRGAEIDLHSIVRRQLVVRRAADWLKRETPPTQGYLDASLRPEYGVLTSWDSGHLLRYYGERPMVQDNFGPWGGIAGFDAGREYFEAHDEADAIAIAERFGIRYVVALPKGSGQVKPSLDSLTRRMAVVRKEGGALAFNGAGLGRHRLVHLADDADLKRPAGQPPWRIAVYEIVPGALVLGTAPAGREVRFEQMLRLPGQPPILYVASVWADASGRYAQRLPYPNEGGYVVRMGQTRRTLRVSEADVREGRTLEGPRLDPGNRDPG